MAKIRIYGRLAIIILTIGMMIWLFFCQQLMPRPKGWETFRSDELHYQIEYPVYLSLDTFSAGYENLHRGLPKGIRAFFYINSFFPGDETVAIFWLADYSLDDAVQWSKETVEAKQKLINRKNEQVGIGSYPALIRTHQIDEAEIRRTMYIPIDKGVFVLEFWTRDYDDETEAVFERMLSSFEIITNE